MFADVCVGVWERGVGEFVVFSMGTRLLTAAKEKMDANVQVRAAAESPNDHQWSVDGSLPAMMSSSVSVSVCAGVATMSPSGAC